MGKGRKWSENSENPIGFKAMKDKKADVLRRPLLCFGFDFSVFFFKSFDFPANEVQHLAVDAAPFVACDVLQLAVGVAVNAQSQVFVLFCFHSITTVRLKISMFVFILSTLCDMMCKMDLF